MSTTNQQGGGNLRHALALTTLDTDRPTVPDERDARIGQTDRASIVAFLTAEARKFAYAEIDDIRAGIPLRADRLGCKASVLRTMAAYIARGDDLLGGDYIPSPADAERFGAAADREVER